MSKFVAITAEEFSGKTWRRSPDFIFANTDAVCPLNAQELADAVLSLPIGFINDGTQFGLVAVQGLEASSNYYLDKDNAWLGSYIPAAYRGYPFALLQNEENASELVLCIDEESQLIDVDGEGESFLEKGSELSDTLKAVLDFLKENNTQRSITDYVCKVLEDLELLVPWDVVVEYEDSSHSVNGLYRVDEIALNDLSEADFAILRKSGALPMAYAQLLSMKHIEKLIEAAKFRATAPENSQPSELTLGGIVSEGTLNFENI